MDGTIFFKKDLRFFLPLKNCSEKLLLISPKSAQMSFSVPQKWLPALLLYNDFAYTCNTLKSFQSVKNNQITRNGNNGNPLKKLHQKKSWNDFKQTYFWRILATWNQLAAPCGGTLRAKASARGLQCGGGGARTGHYYLTLLYYALNC